MTRILIGGLLAVLTVVCAACDGTIFKTFDLKSGQSLSIDARQRLVLVSNREILETRRDGTTVRTQLQIVCTEPSPDAIVAKAAAIAASVTSPELAAALGGSMSESAASIGLRTPTIQLLRDGLFRACEAYMNGLLEKEDYHVVLFNYDRVMTALLIIEAAAGFKAQPNVAINAGQVGVDTSGSSNLTITRPATTGSDGATPAPQASKAANSTAAGKTTSQQAVTPLFAGTAGGYDATAAAAAKDVLKQIADQMIGDPTRFGFCITPNNKVTEEGRNIYFRQICQGMTDVVTAYAESNRLRNKLKEQCLAGRRLDACKDLKW